MEIMCSSKFDWTFWTTFVLALIGALAWLQPLVFSWFQVKEINGKILSNDANTGTVPNNSNHQTIYFQKVAIFSKNKDFFPKDIKVFIKYPSLANELSCVLWTWKELIFTFPEQGQNIRKKLNINLSDYLIQSIVFQKTKQKSVMFHSQSTLKKMKCLNMLDMSLRISMVQKENNFL